jgi:predicted transglutaminase-like cysteine proteinase
VAAVIASIMPSHVMAQSTYHTPNSSALQSCADQPPGPPVQMAMSALTKVEPSAGPQPASKAEAILGGQISKLEQMRFAQAFGGVPGTPAASDRPSSLAQNVPQSCKPRVRDEARPETTPSIAMPANAILGSMSISIARTPFDLKWSVIIAKRGSAKIARILTATGARNSSNKAEQVEVVNRWVNRNIAFGEDRDVYGRADYWAPAAETLRRGVGDCEDFAIAKMELLSALGIARDKMRLVVARDLVRNADHAILVVTLADGRTMMLDNMTDRLLDARLPNDYRPIMSFSQNAKWVHGYVAQPTQQVRMVSAAPVLPVATQKLADVLTVTVEPEMPALSIALLSVPLVLPNGLLTRA